MLIQEFFFVFFFFGCPFFSYLMWINWQFLYKGWTTGCSISIHLLSALLRDATTSSCKYQRHLEALQPSETAGKCGQVPEQVTLDCMQLFGSE